MAKQTKKAPAKESGPKAEKPQTTTYTGDLLQGKYDEVYLERNGILGRTMLRKMRYWCYKIHFATVEEREIPKYPTGLKTFVEELPGFAGWKYFAHTWDIQGENPFKIVLRLQTVWEEWENVMNRVAIPVDAPPEQISARIQALTDEYARKQYKGRH
jgi:hypothetical protein